MNWLSNSCRLGWYFSNSLVSRSVYKWHGVEGVRCRSPEKAAACPTCGPETQGFCEPIYLYTGCLGRSPNPKPKPPRKTVICKQNWDILQWSNTLVRLILSQVGEAVSFQSVNDLTLWEPWPTISLHPAKLQRTCNRSSSLVRSWLMARDCVAWDYVECCSTETGDRILIMLFRDGFCSLLYKGGSEKRSSGLCCVYVPKEIPRKAAGRKQSIYFWMPVAWLFVDCKKDAFGRELQRRCSSSVCQVP